MNDGTSQDTSGDTASTDQWGDSPDVDSLAG